MNKSVRVVIIKENKILLIHREKNGVEFYVCPGGTIESGESIEEAAIREIKEETNISVTNLGNQLQTIEDIWEGKPKMTYYFLADKWTGDNDIRFIGEELAYMSSKNKYNLVWVELSKLSELTIYPQDTYKLVLKQIIAKFNP